MSDSFQGIEDIILQPGSSSVPYTFTFSVCSSLTANDGSIPFGATISSVAAKAFDEDGDDVTTEIIASSSVSHPTVTLTLKYPATSGAGRYSLEFVLTYNTGATDEFDFTRLYAKDIAV